MVLKRGGSATRVKKKKMKLAGCRGRSVVLYVRRVKLKSTGRGTDNYWESKRERELSSVSRFSPQSSSVVAGQCCRVGGFERFVGARSTHKSACVCASSLRINLVDSYFLFVCSISSVPARPTCHTRNRSVILNQQVRQVFTVTAQLVFSCPWVWVNWYHR